MQSQSALHAETLLRKLNSQRICGIFVDSSLISRSGEVVFYHSAILNAIASSTAILPIIADQYSHVTLNLFFDYVYLGVISNDVSLKTYRELWNLGRQLKLKELQTALHPFSETGDSFSPTRKRSKYPVLRKEKEAPEKKKPRLIATASHRKSPRSSSEASFTTDRSGARFRIPKARLKSAKRKLFDQD
ncbi:Oidioi.mRNA.OKI2018_I69.chr2.g4154.t1.cds [Oikopleura dioica]|uniref:Oidioi.mRNA.OKI2018_I69.chr2.g4154.t1.cds n=1 Tax=Oikopleura dioica TaxID=34765 RepID=A0ABN7T1Y4_OIKDI|nr:Oidioi.mRNA.OKI2018_I69.chr2.g4154.t1.cds [Oikopleura dioica]